jgi:spermidine/putrescine transport system substrate-binding protein
VPYTIYTTGISWRKDHVPEDPYTMANPWAMLWQPKYKGKVAILDDSREGISLGLMKNGIYNLNTTNPSQISRGRPALLDLAQLTNVHIDNNDYTNVPAGQIWIHQSWSGDIATAAYYMPEGVPVDVVGYWFPPDSKGPVGNDLIAVLKGAENPVLAHLFLNYMLDLHNGLTNYYYTGYMQPLNGITPQRLGAGAAAAEVPDVHHGPPLRLPAGGHGAADPGDRERPVGAGMAAREERLGG